MATQAALAFAPIALMPTSRSSRPWSANFLRPSYAEKFSPMPQVAEKLLSRTPG
jgi:hypothetical protein